MEPVNSEEFVPGMPVKHKSRILHEARVHSISKSGKSVGVRHNVYHPYGVCWDITYFNRDQIESAVVK